MAILFWFTVCTLYRRQSFVQLHSSLIIMCVVELEAKCLHNIEMFIVVLK